MTMTSRCTSILHETAVRSLSRTCLGFVSVYNFSENQRTSYESWKLPSNLILIRRLIFNERMVVILEKLAEIHSLE